MGEVELIIRQENARANMPGEHIEEEERGSEFGGKKE